MPEPRRRVAAGMHRSRIRPPAQKPDDDEAEKPAPPALVTYPRTQMIVSALTAVTAFGAVVITALSLYATREHDEVSAQTQYTDRYVKAIEQLDQAGPEHLQGRLGGIYALERLARDSPRDQPTIIEVLAAFIRTTDPQPDASFDSHGPATCPLRGVVPDIQAALDVLGRRDVAHDSGTSINLSRTCLRNAKLTGANLRGADLSGANLSESNVDEADLSGAFLTDTGFRGAYLYKTNLRDAELGGADLTDANLVCADLRGVDPEDVGDLKASERTPDPRRCG